LQSDNNNIDIFKADFDNLDYG